MKINLKTTIATLRVITGSSFGEGRADRINKSIKSILSELEQKKVIKITSKDFEPLKNYGTSDLLIINFYDHHDVDSKFTQIYEKDFELIENIFHYHIYVATKRWSGRGFFECSYDRWTRVLGKSRQFVFNMVKEAVNQEIIYTSIGDYYGNDTESKIQHTNRYKVTPFEQKDKSNFDKLDEFKKVNMQFHEDNQYGDIYFINLSTGINVFETEELNGYSIFPEVKDYEFYMKVRDRGLRDGIKQSSEVENKYMHIAESRIKNLRENKAFKRKWEEAEKSYALSKDFVDLSDKF